MTAARPFKCSMCPARELTYEGLRHHFKGYHGNPKAPLSWEEQQRRSRAAERKLMGYLKKSQITGTPAEFAIREVAVQDWGGGGVVLIQGGGGDERDDFELSTITGKGKNRDVNLKRMRSKLVARSIVEAPEDFVLPPSGRCARLPRMYNEAEVVDLASRSARDISTVFDAAQPLWGLKAEDVEELVGESGAGQSAGFGIASPANGAVPAESFSAG